MSHGNNGMRRMPICDYERERIHKMIREGLSNTIIKIRTGRSKQIINKMRHELEASAHHAVTGD